MCPTIKPAKKPPPPLTHERLKEVLDYNPDTGVFTWSSKLTHNSYRGKVAGRVDEEGYRRIGIDGRLYRANRLAFFYVTGVWPEELWVDHINGNRSDDRMLNLRLATPTQNGANKTSWGNGTRVRKHGYKGVRTYGDKFAATIMHQGIALWTKGLESPEEAHIAYRVMADLLCDEFAAY